MGESSLTETRQGLVDRARKLSTERLIDLTRRNNLLYYRPLTLGSFDLEGFEPSALLDVLAGGSSLLTRLVPPKELEGAPEAIGEDPDRARGGAARCRSAFGRERAAGHIPGFVVKRRAVVGNFSFQKLAMVKDLETWGEAMAENEGVAALAGDPAARLALGRGDASELPEVLDQEPPSQQFLVLDASIGSTASVSALGPRSGVMASSLGASWAGTSPPR